MRQAQIAIEDHRFYEHGALDFKGTLRALVRNSASEGNIQGGSSITQQYVKMVQIEACQNKDTSKEIEDCVKGAQAPTMERKIRELRYAIAMEKKFTKDQILEQYLNIAYYGQGAYGVEAAARHYYSTKASKLTLPQAAMLAGLVQNPDSNNPVRNLSAALDRRDVVINRMAELKLISPAQVKSAKKATFNPKKVKPTRNGCVGTTFPFLCDYVRRTLLNTPSLGKTTSEREHLINRGGLTIQTAIDPKTQRIAQRAGEQGHRPEGPADLDHEHGAARDRLDHRDGAEPLRDGPEHQEGRDLLQLLGRVRDGWRRGLPGRLDLQGLHRGRRPGEGRAAHQAVQRPVADGLQQHDVPDLSRQRSRARAIGPRTPPRAAAWTCTRAWPSRSTPTSCSWSTRSASARRRRWPSGSVSSSPSRAARP